MNTTAPGRLNINRRRVTGVILVQFSGSVAAQGMVAVVLLLTAHHPKEPSLARDA